MSQETKKPATTYIVDICSVYGVDEKTADNLQIRPNDLNQKWLIEQVLENNIHIVNIIEEDGEENE